MLAAFSMASLTDVIFLLLVFFMATSTFVFPTAVEVNLPQSDEQTSAKPLTRVYVDSLGVVSAAYAEGEPQQFALDELAVYLQTVMEQDTTQRAVAVYADKAVEYGKVVEVLNVGTKAGVKMVLATRAN
ncbi:MAG: biopolymer transporter ExbD [Clostridium sp.]|nr:biopolymer transporter ExbD [Clostridium sp.]